MTTSKTQLALLDLPEGETKPKPRVRRQTTADHVKALLAELDRIATIQTSRADHLAQLFEAWERSHVTLRREDHRPRRKLQRASGA